MALLISCKEASRIISQMQDQPISFASRIVIRLHLLGCDACTQFLHNLRFLRNAMRRYRD